MLTELDDHPYRQDAGPDEGDVDQFETNLRRLHRRGQWRLAGAGMLVLLGGLAVLFYGMHVQHLQDASDVRFLLPIQLIFIGAFAAGLGAILLLVALILRLRSDRLR